MTNQTTTTEAAAEIVSQMSDDDRASFDKSDWSGFASWPCWSDEWTHLAVGDVLTEVGVQIHQHGDLCEHETAEPIRPATEKEHNESIEAARIDGGAGVIDVDGRSCYVESTR